MTRAPGCQALPRQSYYATGWTCNGTNLVAMMMGPGGIPSVLPAHLVDAAMQQEWADVSYDPYPLAGGDHYHMIAPPPPQPAQG